MLFYKISSDIVLLTEKFEFVLDFVFLIVHQCIFVK